MAIQALHYTTSVQACIIACHMYGLWIAWIEYNSNMTAPVANNYFKRRNKSVGNRNGTSPMRETWMKFPCISCFKFGVSHWKVSLVTPPPSYIPGHPRLPRPWCWRWTGREGQNNVSLDNWNFEHYFIGLNFQCPPGSNLFSKVSCFWRKTPGCRCQCLCRWWSRRPRGSRCRRARRRRFAAGPGWVCVGRGRGGNTTSRHWSSTTGEGLYKWTTPVTGENGIVASVVSPPCRDCPRSCPSPRASCTRSPTWSRWRSDRPCWWKSWLRPVRSVGWDAAAWPPCRWAPTPSGSTTWGWQVKKGEWRFHRALPRGRKGTPTKLQSGCSRLGTFCKLSRRPKCGTRVQSSRRACGRWPRRGSKYDYINIYKVLRRALELERSTHKQDIFWRAHLSGVNGAVDAEFSSLVKNIFLHGREQLS